MKSIAVTGANGQLGECFRQISREKSEFKWIFAGRKELDITEETEVSSFFEKNNPQVLINCAAYTLVDQSEAEPENAYLANKTAAAQLAGVCRELGIDFIHYSTDYVYDGKNNRAYTETDDCNPSSVYGESKLAGEKAILKAHPEAIIIRTSWLYSSKGENFFLTMRKLATKMEEIKVVDDQIGTPTLASDLAAATLALIEEMNSGNDDIRGQLFNFSNHGVCSWYDFAHAILELSGYTGKLIPVSSSAFPRPAPRPAFSLMSKSKFMKTVPSFEIPHWRDSLKGLFQ